MGKDINNEREIKFRAKAINDDFSKENGCMVIIRKNYGAAIFWA